MMADRVTTSPRFSGGHPNEITGYVARQILGVIIGFPFMVGIAAVVAGIPAALIAHFTGGEMSPVLVVMGMGVVLVLWLVNAVSETRHRVEWLRREGIDEPALVTSPPDVEIGPLVGHRMWKLIADTGLSVVEPIPLMAGPVWGTPWTGPDFTAECLPSPWRRTRPPCAPVPGEDCACGIYALKDRDALESRAGVIVSGRIEMRGRVLEGEFGFRASHARVLGPLSIEARCDEALAASSELGSTRHRCLEPAEVVRDVDGHYSARCERHHQPDPAFEDWSADEFVEHASAWLQARYGCDVVAAVGGE